MTLEEFINWKKLKPLLLLYGIPAAVLLTWAGVESIVNGVGWLSIYVSNWYYGCDNIEPFVWVTNLDGVREWTSTQGWTLAQAQGCE